jgi:hypothetical protein
MNQFFIEDGSQYLVFFYQEPDIEKYPKGVDSFRPGYSPVSTRSGANSAKQIKPKVTIADLNEQSLRGICLCFLRNSKNVIITGQNIANVCDQTFSPFCLRLFLFSGSVFSYIRM